MSLVWIYIAVIIALCLVYALFYRNRRNITKTLVRQVDTMIFHYDLEVYKNRSTIYDYDTTKHLLFHNQTAFFEKGKKYTDIVIKLIQDNEYLSGLLQKNVVDPSAIRIVKATYITWQKINTLKEYTHTILIILTLGIAKLFLP